LRVEVVTGVIRDAGEVDNVCASSHGRVHGVSIADISNHEFQHRIVSKFSEDICAIPTGIEHANSVSSLD
jgi:hypothetical protein